MKRILLTLLKLLLVLAVESHGQLHNPVSPPELSQLCLFHGEIRVSCSSAGERPQYSWTLDDRPLDRGVAFLSDENQTVILKNATSGSITCTVSNHGSKENTTHELLTCPGPEAPAGCALANGTENEVGMDGSPNASPLLNATILLRAGGVETASVICSISLHTPNETSKDLPSPACTDTGSSIVIPVALGTCLILLALLLVTCCLYIKTQKQPKTSQRMTGDTPEDPQELVYSQVQVTERKDRPKKQPQEPQVVYGEVKKSKAARSTPRRQEETVYADIRT